MSAPQPQDSTKEYWYWAACVNLVLFTLFFLLDKNTGHAKNSMKRLLDGTQDFQIQEIEIECLHRSFIIERPNDLEFMEACFGKSRSAADDSFADICFTLRIQFKNGADYEVLNAGYDSQNSILCLSIPEHDPIEYGWYTDDVELAPVDMPPSLREFWASVVSSPVPQN